MKAGPEEHAFDRDTRLPADRAFARTFGLLNNHQYCLSVSRGKRAQVQVAFICGHFGLDNHMYDPGKLNIRFKMTAADGSSHQCLADGCFVFCRGTNTSTNQVVEKFISCPKIPFSPLFVSLSLCLVFGLWPLNNLKSEYNDFDFSSLYLPPWSEDQFD